MNSNNILDRTYIDLLYYLASHGFSAIKSCEGSLFLDDVCSCKELIYKGHIFPINEKEGYLVLRAKSLPPKFNGVICHPLRLGDSLRFLPEKDWSSFSEEHLEFEILTAILEGNIITLERGSLKYPRGVLSINV